MLAWTILQGYLWYLHKRIANLDMVDIFSLHCLYIQLIFRHDQIQLIFRHYQIQLDPYFKHRLNTPTKTLRKSASHMNLSMVSEMGLAHITTQIFE